MAGRSGRFGSGGENTFGRGIIVATSPAEADAFFSRYVNGSLESLSAAGFPKGLDSFLLEYLSRSGSAAEETLVSFFAGSLSGIGRLRSETGDRVRAALEHLAGTGLIAEGEGSGDGEWQVEPAGRLLGVHGVSPATGGLFREYLLSRDPDRAGRLERLFLTGLSSESEETRIPVTGAEWRGGRLEREFLRLVDEGEIGDRVAVEAGYEPEDGRMEFDYRAGVALKKALLLDAYADGEAAEELEERFGVRLGLIQKVGESGGWLLRAMADVAHAVKWPAEAVERVGILAECVCRGLPEDCLGLSGLLTAGVSRSGVLRLAGAGLRNRAAIRRASRDLLEKLLTGRSAAAAAAWAGGTEKPGEDARTEASKTEKEGTIEVDPNRPDRMIYKGKEIPLTNIQFRLVEILWKNRGRCVSYDEIMRYVWEGAIVEQNNVIDQKGRILKKLASIQREGGVPPIRTIRGRGLLFEES
jgi:hypothetical protein